MFFVRNEKYGTLSKYEYILLNFSISFSSIQHFDYLIFFVYFAIENNAFKIITFLTPSNYQILQQVGLTTVRK